MYLIKFSGQTPVSIIIPHLPTPALPPGKMFFCFLLVGGVKYLLLPQTLIRGLAVSCVRNVPALKLGMFHGACASHVCDSKGNRRSISCGQF